MLLSSAKVLKDMAGDVRGRVALQPAEKMGGGAEAMVRDGLIERFVTRVYGLHVIAALGGVGKQTVPSGTFALRPGRFMAGSDSFDLTIEVRGAAPHLANDPTLVAAELLTALQRIVSCEIDPAEPAVLTIGAIEGGTTYNVISPSVSLKGSLRTFSESTKTHMQARIKQIADGVCAAAGARYSINWLPSCPATINNPDEARFVRRVLTERFGESRVVEIQPVMAREDFAYFLSAVPGCFYSSAQVTTSARSPTTIQHLKSANSPWLPASKRTSPSQSLPEAMRE